MLHEIEKLLDQKPSGGVYRFAYQDRFFWIKICGENKRTVLRFASHALTRFKSLAFLASNAVLDPSERLAHEIHMLTLCKALQLPVPTVVSYGPRFFVLEDKGTTIEKLDEIRVDGQLIRDIFLKLACFHEKNIAHGRPALRDILWHQGELTFVDFEEGTYPASPTLQARDVLLLLTDVCQLKEIFKSERVLALTAWRERVNSATWAELLRIANFLRKFEFVAHAMLRHRPGHRLSSGLLAALNIIDESHETIIHTTKK